MNLVQIEQASSLFNFHIKQVSTLFKFQIEQVSLELFLYRRKNLKI